MRKRAYLFAREMVWKRVAQGYMESFARVRSDRMETPHVQFSARMTPKSLDQLPELKLNHLHQMTDDTGMLQHAIFTIPNRSRGLYHRRQCSRADSCCLLEQLEAEPRSAADRFACRKLRRPVFVVPGACVQSRERQIQELSPL